MQLARSWSVRSLPWTFMLSSLAAAKLFVVSDLPKGYLRCSRCTATFPGKTEDGKEVERCPGCGLDASSFRLKTARLALRMMDPAASTTFFGGKLGAFEIVAIVVIALGFAGGVAFLVMRK